MAVNFIVIFPLGAIAARQLRSHWLTNPRLRASMFYVHIFTQITGVACATAGFVIATRWFNVPYDQVMYSHGRMGIAILVMVYSQVCTVSCCPVLPYAVLGHMPFLKRMWDSCVPA